MIERYDITIDGSMKCVENGEFVFYSHYEELKSSHDKLVEACEKMVKCNHTQCGVCDIDCPDGENIPLKEIEQALKESKL